MTTPGNELIRRLSLDATHHGSTSDGREFVSNGHLLVEARFVEAASGTPIAIAQGVVDRFASAVAGSPVVPLARLEPIGEFFRTPNGVFLGSKYVAWFRELELRLRVATPEAELLLRPSAPLSPVPIECFGRSIGVLMPVRPPDRASVPPAVVRASQPPRPGLVRGTIVSADRALGRGAVRTADGLSIGFDLGRSLVPNLASGMSVDVAFDGDRVHAVVSPGEIAPPIVTKSEVGVAISVLLSELSRLGCLRDLTHDAFVYLAGGRVTYDADAIVTALRACYGEGATTRARADRVLVLKSAPPEHEEPHPNDGRLDARAIFEAFESVSGRASERPTGFDARTVFFGTRSIDLSESVDPIAAFFADDLRRRGESGRWWTNPTNRRFGAHVYLNRCEPIASPIPWLAGFIPVGRVDS